MSWWQLIYTEADLLSNLQSFSKESPSTNRLRMLFLAINFSNSAFASWLLGIRMIFTYVTHLTITFTNIYFMLAIWSSIKARSQKHPGNASFNQLAWLHITFEISFLFNLVVMTLYWSLLHQEQLEHYAGKPLNILNLYWSHGVPGLCALANFAMTDVVIRASHAKAILVFMVVYGYVNYCEVKATGTPLYWFLAWDDVYETSAIYAGLVLMTTGIFVMLAQLTQWLKRGGSSRRSGSVKEK